MSIATAGSRRHAALMDRNYRFQRHIYDATRKYYLLGRDPMISGLAVPRQGLGPRDRLWHGQKPVPRRQTLSIAQNSSASTSPHAMLEKASATLAKEGLAGRTKLAQGDATTFEAKTLFGVKKFDRIFISYALSMIPDWEGAVAAALRALSPQGSLHIVEFGQQERLPRLFKYGLHAWLRKYHVTPRHNLRAELHRQASEAGRTLRFDRLYRDYVWLAVIEPRTQAHP